MRVTRTCELTIAASGNDVGYVDIASFQSNISEYF